MEPAAVQNAKGALVSNPQSGCQSLPRITLPDQRPAPVPFIIWTAAILLALAEFVGLICLGLLGRSLKH
jgi:hypothetical protein